MHGVYIRRQTVVGQLRGEVLRDREIHVRSPGVTIIIADILYIGDQVQVRAGLEHVRLQL